MPFPSVPLPSIPLPRWTTRPRSRPGSTPTSLKPLETLDEKDTFGVPCPEDPDPFGVLALEKAGLEIREAGSKSRPTSDAFEYRPSPTSPVFANFARHSMQSIDSVSRHDSKRDSKRSVVSVDQGTQTANFDGPHAEPIAEIEVSKGTASPTKKGTEDLAWMSDEKGGNQRFEEEPEVYVEERAPTVQIVAQSVPAQSIASPRLTRAKLVTIPKRVPPALPPRSPYRTRVEGAISEEMERDAGEEEDYAPSSHYSSPTRSVFEREEPAEPNPWEDVALRAGSPRPETSASKTTSGSEDDGKEDAGSPETEYSAVLQPAVDVVRERERLRERDEKEGVEHPPHLPHDPIHHAPPPTLQTSHPTIPPPLPPRDTALEPEIFHSVPTTPIEIEAPPQAIEAFGSRLQESVGISG